MECVSTFGGPQVLLPTRDVDRWIDGLGEDTPVPDAGLYGLACSVNEYCGVISPWGRPLLVFGDIPADIYWLPNPGQGVFARWIASDSEDEFLNFVRREVTSVDWPYSTEFMVVDHDMTLMDSCTYRGDNRSRIRLDLPVGSYEVHSRYTADDRNMVVLHRLQRIG